MLSIQKSKKSKKIELFEKLDKLIQKYKVIAIFNLFKVRAKIIHQLRSKLRGEAEIVIVKKSILEKVLEKNNKKMLIEFLSNIKQPIGVIFTNMSAFKLSLILEKSKVLMHAKGGEKADIDVIVPECNTGLQPGPILSDFGKMKIPTRIEGGSIWIAKDTLVARKGEEISPMLASLLVKLDIKSVLRGIDLILAYEDGLIIEGEELRINLEDYKMNISKAFENALKLSIEAQYITKENVPYLINKAILQAKNLGIYIGYPSKDLIKEIIIKAYMNAEKIKEIVKI
ncbi:MAG: 50S ribosomal protein L10 [Nitrososphaerota archaeon]